MPGRFAGSVPARRRRVPGVGVFTRWAQKAKPLPDELSRRIQSLLDLRAPGGGQLTPDGKTLFFT